MSIGQERKSRTVIVGAGLAGLRTAEELRKAGYDGEIVLCGAEPHPPYDRPPLSKEFLAGALDDTALRPREFFDEQRIDFRPGRRAVALDTTHREVTFADGENLGYDDLVVATGLRPRRLPGLPELAGLHVLRSVDDARMLRDSLASARHVTVVGAGFIGCELASSARSAGVDVTLVEPQSTPLASVLGEQVGSLVARLHVDAGVDVRCGTSLASVEGDTRVRTVVLADGDEIATDAVVIGIGSVPETEWLDGGGLEVANGVVCDDSGRTGVPHVWAVGDVAAWRAPDGAPARVEHWTNAGEQAAVLAAALTGKPRPADQVPYFWSDQHGLKIQSLGASAPSGTVHVVRDDGRKFVVYYEVDGTFVGVVGAGAAGQVMKMRGRIGSPIEDVVPTPV
ncbi:FAD-dependent oxidoreductase [Rhodococcus sp. HNM0569]|uniref:NAD(P)/FAD-dependent oxidoreductase n=1 Tax=Rhodococcus sp. HNM0569 TaxID=2716340 RepID=UPI00146EB66B|nr:FAD-dependent oxidoreductase [Rhodococcus sp. HNM0569]NLU82752.1 FAD-dependent oxidoreductase [Rhodococcus sp. HNM0569]